MFSRLLLQSPVSVPTGPQSLRCLRELVPLLTGVQSCQGKAEIQPLLLLFLSADYALGEASEASQWVPCPASPFVSSLGACGPTISQHYPFRAPKRSVQVGESSCILQR